MESLTLQTKQGPDSSSSFNLIRLNDSSECLELVAGQNQEILPGLTLKVDDHGNGILELAQESELEVNISGKRVVEVAQFQSNDLISIGDKDFLLLTKESTVNNSDACKKTVEDEKIDFDNVFESPALHQDEKKDSNKNKRKKFFSLFLFSITCLIIASLGFLLFMNSKISDFNRMANMANIFQRKIARILKQKPKVVVKEIQMAMDQIFKETPPLSSPLQNESEIIKKKKKSKPITNEPKSMPENIVQTEDPIIKMKPAMAIGQKDRERVYKEIEMLELEYKLDPFNVRKSLHEMRDSIVDQSIRRKIDKVLQRL